MATITLNRSRLPVASKPGQSLMESLLSAGLPVASSCQGEGICGKCSIRILSGRENLSPENDLERRRRKELSIPEGERLSCQTQVLGDILIDTPYW